MTLILWPWHSGWKLTVTFELKIWLWFYWVLSLWRSFPWFLVLWVCKYDINLWTIIGNFRIAYKFLTKEKESTLSRSCDTNFFIVAMFDDFVTLTFVIDLLLKLTKCSMNYILNSYIWYCTFLDFWFSLLESIRTQSGIGQSRGNVKVIPELCKVINKDISQILYVVKIHVTM